MEAKKPKQNKPAGKTGKFGSSPIPKGPCGGSSFDEINSLCGHSGCGGGKCNVRYVGPTTHLRDHHIIHAARGASHVWTAAIVAGLAVVLTGALGYAAFGADTGASCSIYSEFQQINLRFDKIEQMLSTLVNQCQVGAKCQNPTTCDAAYINTCTAKCQQLMLTATNNIPVETCKKNCETQCNAPSQCTDDQIKECKNTYLKYAEAVNSVADLNTKLQTCLKTCTWPETAQPTVSGAGQNYTQASSSQGTVSGAGQNYTQAPSSQGMTAGGFQGVNYTQASTTPVITPTTTGGAPSTVGAPQLSDCVKKCYNDRVLCFQKAGVNYTALRKCVTDEAVCKQSCAK